MALTIEPATRRQAKGRMLLFGSSGSGKTVSALRIANGMGGRILVIDTENRSSEKYEGLIIEDGAPAFKFDILALGAPYSPQRYMEAMKLAEGYDVVVMDSITHEWDGTGGVKEIVDAAKSRFGGNSQAAWSVGTPLHNKFLEAILAAPFHVIATARSKTEWVPGEDAKGRQVFNKAGYGPMQRDTIEFEFDVTMLLDAENQARVMKTRANPHFPPGGVTKPTEETGRRFLDWLTTGAEPIAVVTPAAVEVMRDHILPADAHGEQGGIVTPKVDIGSLVDAATERIHALQTDFGDYAEGVNWVDQMAIKCAEWWGVEDLDHLTAEQLQTLIARLDATRTKRQQELAAASS